MLNVRFHKAFFLSVFSFVTLSTFALLSINSIEGFAQSSAMLSSLSNKLKWSGNPFVNKVFIQEQGQFSRNARENKIQFPEEVLYGVENAEFNAYFTAHGIIFQFPERKNTEENKKEKEGEAEEKTIETIWHSATLQWLNSNPSVEINAEQKVPEYYNYEGIAGESTINFVPAYKKITYKNLYAGVDLEFELPDEGGIKYRFIIQPNVVVPDIAFQWEGTENPSLDENGSLHIEKKFEPSAINSSWQLFDKTPAAFTASSKTNLPVQYSISSNTVRFQFSSGNISSSEGIVIDPWLINPASPGANLAYDIAEDAAGNVFVLGNYSKTSSGDNHMVQKYNSSGVLQWTYQTYSIFLGDIAVDNPGNVYLIGGYSAGKRQKLNSAGVQQWVFPGLVEEWRLAFNYSKTVLTAGGYFLDPGGNNLGKIDVNTGAVSNEIIYNLETRAIATDCNGDMYSLHVTFGYSGTAAGNVLRKTYANFTPAGSMLSGFLLCEAEPVGVGYAPNPDYAATIYQGNNGIAVYGPYVYIYDGATLRRVDKNALSIVNSVTVPGGSKLMCSGVAADLCGNIYVGSTNSIVEYDSTLNYVATLPASGVVYDLGLATNGELLACGNGFVGSFSLTCTAPPALTATAPTVCQGGNISLTATGGNAPYNYLWQPGGQTTNSISNAATGTYTYTVNDAFCHTFVGTVTVNPNPAPAFTNTNVCLGIASQFTDNTTISNGSVTGWSWNFGDGNTLTQQSPSHTYSASGTYTVTLVATSASGCVDSVKNVVNVYPLPVPNFSSTTICQGNATQFTDLSTGAPSSWSWNFGDGNTSVIQSPSHTYASSGTYTVTLVATNSTNCSDSISQVITVYPNPASTFTATTVCLNIPPTTFTDLSTISSGSITGWSWNFGDGGNSIQQSPSHTYSASGTYSVTLVATSVNGCADTISQNIIVNPVPVASFTAAPVCFNNAATNFIDLSTGTPTVWNWNFGDGNSDSVQNPSHTYNAAGTFSVTLIAINSSGCSDTASQNVLVYPLPFSTFSVTTVCIGNQTCFGDLSTVSSGSITAWSWNFGDPNLPNNISNVQNPCITYTASGTYPVFLTVTSSNNCQSTTILSAVVNPPPVAAFSAPNICLNAVTNFTDNSSGATQWYWQFGDGGTSTQQSPSHTYLGYGNYIVTLIASSAGNCSDTIQDTVTVYPSPVAFFNSDSVCVGFPTTFSDASFMSAGNIISWHWDFGDGDTSSLQNPVHAYSSAGIFNAVLTVTSNNGCISSVTLPVIVHKRPNANFSYNPPDITLVDEVAFTDLSTFGAVQWFWDFGDSTIDSVQHPSHIYTNVGTYIVTLIVTSPFGCKDTVKYPLEVNQYTFYIPNTFTPNGDELNDFFFAQGVGIKDYEFSIFDRWGNLVFYCHVNDLPQTPACRWDGKVRDGNSNTKIQEDVYVWKVKLTNVFKKEYTFTGNVNVIR